MTNADLTEMEWLTATLRATADRLQRATQLLRAAGDLEKLQAKLSAIAAERPSVDQVRPGATSPAVAGRSAEAVERRAASSIAVAVGASRAVAVFDHETQTRMKVAKNTAGASRPPF
jgi:hypothetical protein